MRETSSKLIYVAGPLSMRLSISKFIKMLEKTGFTCTYDWTKHGQVDGDLNLAKEMARKEIEGASSASMLIGFIPGGRGMHVELGAALAMHTPVLLVPTKESATKLDVPRSEGGCFSTFYHHDLVRVAPLYQSLEDLVSIVADYYTEAHSY